MSFVGKVKKFDKEYFANWRKNNRSKIRGRANQWRKDNLKKRLAVEERWRRNNPEKYKLTNKRADDKACENLTDHYIKTALYTQLRIHSDQVTPEMIELKREQIILHRAIRTLVKVVNGTN